jgi:hypothetical protein
MGKKIGEMTKAELDAAMEGVVRITDEDIREYGMEDIPDGDFMSGETHPEEMKKIMNCLADKFLAQYAIKKAELQSKGEWKEEYESNDGDAEVDEDMEGMSIFDYEERYAEEEKKEKEDD